MFFPREKTKNTPYPSNSVFLFFLASYSWAPPCPLYSHTIYFTPPLFLFLLSHLSSLSSPGTSMCFSLIEMHFNVVQISSLQLKFELAMYTCARTCTDVCTSDEKKKKTSWKWRHYLPVPFFFAFFMWWRLLCSNLCFECSRNEISCFEVFVSLG